MYEDLKFDLCCGARILFRNGLSWGIAGHLSVLVGPNRMIANRFGPSFATVTPGDVLTLDFEGNIIE
ncbi:MAG TPA: class II aldolase/adducin family protein, partial [Blastocatellia bacterium]|nr:class II aldolase/adducin family protein [Blastocatellia bacterium]